jgi:DNA modification methylase
MTFNHIFHLDSGSEEARDELLSVAPIKCIITDPPFGMEFVSNRAVTPEGKAKNVAIEGDESVEEALARFNRAVMPAMEFLDDEAEMYVFTAWHVGDIWKQHLADLAEMYGLEMKMKLIWDKGYPGQGDLTGNWGCGYEEIYYLKKGRRPMPYRRSGIIHVDKLPAGANIHPTEKPVELLQVLIEMSTDPGDLVVDFFSGSGSTSVAALRCGRNSVAFEKDERYIAKSRARLTQKTLFG